MSLVDSNSEDSFSSISENNLSTQAYSTNYLDSISDGDSYSDNGLVLEEEIVRGFERMSEDESLSQEELDQVQNIRDFNVIYNEQNNRKENLA